MIRKLIALSPFLLHAFFYLAQMPIIDAFLISNRSLDSKQLWAPKSTIKPNTAKPALALLWVSNQRLDEDVLNDSGESLEALPTPKSLQQKKNEAKWQHLKEINNKFWDYTCNFLYVGISCLILLNFCGFGYTISAEEGLNVMPLNTYRQQRQWKQEIQRLQNQPFPKPLSVMQQAPDEPLINNPETF
jgi:hypothetical protein